MPHCFYGYKFDRLNIDINIDSSGQVFPCLISLCKPVLILWHVKMSSVKKPCALNQPVHDLCPPASCRSFTRDAAELNVAGQCQLILLHGRPLCFLNAGLTYTITQLPLTGIISGVRLHYGTPHAFKHFLLPHRRHWTPGSSKVNLWVTALKKKVKPTDKQKKRRL